MNRVLSIVALLILTVGAWADQVRVNITTNPEECGTVTYSISNNVCTLTVEPEDGYYLTVENLTAVKVISGSVVQAPARRNINIDENVEITATNASADPSGVTTYTFAMPTDENISVNVTAEFQERTPIDDARITLATTSFTYDGTAKEPAVSSVVFGETTLNDADYEVSYSNNTDAGTATVTVTGKRTYTGTATTTFTINKAALQLTASFAGWTYGDIIEVPQVTLTGNLGDGEMSFFYKVKDADDDTYTDVQPENVGNYTLRIDVEETDNYAAGSVTADFVISGKTITDDMVALEGETPFVFNNEVQVPEVIVTDEINEDTYPLEDGDYDVSYELVGETTTALSSSDDVVNAGSYNVVVTGKGNYTGTVKKGFTIAKANITPTVALEGWTFGATAKTPVVTGNSGNGKVSYSYKGANDVNFSETVPANAGTYTIKANVGETTNYNAGEATSTFTIAKADMSMVSVAYEDLDYTGAAQQLFTVNDVPENATVKYICQEINGPNDMICDPNDDMFTTSVPTATNAGYYGIIYKVEGTNNYNGTEASQTYCVKIEAATITEVTLDNTSLPYNGSVQTVTITSVEAGDLELSADDYTVTVDGVAVTGVITAKDVKEYTVTVTGKGNFKGTESTKFSIVNRTLADNEVTFHDNWATFYSADGVVMLPSGVGAYVATGVGDGVVTVSQISYIPEKVAVLLNNQTETTTENTNVINNMLRHADEDTDVSEIYGTVYGLHNGTMMRVTGTIPEGKNYLLVPDEVGMGPEAPQLTIVFENESNTTGISEARSKMEDVRGDVYDLMGRKVQKPSKKGLYIQKGHKVVINK